MIKLLKRINKILIDLLAGILLFGIISEGIGVWFVKDKTGYTIGLCIGILLAMLMAVHMAWSLDTAFEEESMEAQKHIRVHGIIRYLVVILVFAVVMYSGVANPLSTFWGVMSLKVAAYLQPFTHKFMKKIQQDGEQSS